MRASVVIRVVAALDAAGIRSGITGGWGIDALLRGQTRPHRDLDVGVATEQVPAAITALGALGYAVTEDQRPARLALTGPDGSVDLHPIDWSAGGEGVQTGFNGQQFLYPPGSLDAEGEIAGHPVKCATPSLQTECHMGYEPTARDRCDMAELARSFSLELPPPYQD